MAFVAIDNPAGIQHHGGQMDWCRISPTRIAIVTFTADNKALVQEANFTGGATVLGPASFLKQVTPRSSNQFTYMKPRIKSLGSDRLFIMVPASFASIPTGAGTVRIFGTSEYTALSPVTDVPITHTCIIAIRNTDGTYTVDSQIDVKTQNATENTTYPTYNAAMDIEINPNGLAIYINQSVATGATSLRQKMISTLTLTAGKITSQAMTVVPTAISGAVTSVALAVREVLTPQLVPLKMHLYAASYATPLSGVQNSGATVINRDFWTSQADTWPAANANANGNYLSLNSYLPIDIAAKTFLYTGVRLQTLGGTCYLNNVLQTAGAQIINPLDSAWVTDTVACTIGMAGEINANGNPDTLVSPCLDGDAAYSLNPAYHVTPFQSTSRVRALDLVFKSLVGGGLYAGPFDPIRTPYFTKDYFNFGPMIHRINDTAFWIVGCFREGAAGEDKLGVITVKA